MRVDSRLKLGATVQLRVGRRVLHVETGVESAWLQRLRLKPDELLSSFALNLNSRPLRRGEGRGREPGQRAELHGGQVVVRHVGCFGLCERCVSQHTVIRGVGWFFRRCPILIHQNAAVDDKPR